MHFMLEKTSIQKMLNLNYFKVFWKLKRYFHTRPFGMANGYSTCQDCFITLTFHELWLINLITYTYFKVIK